LDETDVLVCDEMSMITSKVARIMMYRLAHSTVKSQAQKLILFVGDHAQLPPVCHHINQRDNQRSGDICKTCHIMYSNVWQQATKYHFTTAYRQAKDFEYLQFLNIIRFRPPTESELLNTLQQQFWYPNSKEELQQGYHKDTTFLCSHVEHTIAYNKDFLHWLAKTHPNIVSNVTAVHMQTNAPSEGEVHQQLTKWIYEKDFHLLPYVAIGAKVVIRENISKRNGVVNGALGTIVHVAVEDKQVKHIYVQVHNTKTVVRFKRTLSHTKWHKGIKYYKSTFPLALAYAITAHKAQGMTIDGPTIIHIKEAFAPGMLYVVLSRITERALLKIVGGLHPTQFIPIPLP
jgi:ATP-dependent exoDNAse (exonuclease V) alpha subunit